MLGSLPQAYAYWKGVHCSLLYPVIHPQKPDQVMAVVHLANKTDALRRGFGVSLIHFVCVYTNLLCGSVAGEYSQDAHYPSSSLSRSSISCTHAYHDTEVLGTHADDTDMARVEFGVTKLAHALVGIDRGREAHHAQIATTALSKCCAALIATTSLEDLCEVLALSGPAAFRAEVRAFIRTRMYIHTHTRMLTRTRLQIHT